MKYVYSLDGKDFDNGFYENRDEALRNALDDLHKQKGIFIAKMEQFKPVVRADYILSDIYNEANEFSKGQTIESYLMDVTDEQKKELSELLTSVYRLWEKSHNLDRWIYKETTIEEIRINDLLKENK